MAAEAAKPEAGHGEGREMEPGLGGFRLAEAPGHLLRRAQQRHLEIFVEEVGAEGPTPRQFAAILTICQHPGLNQTALVQATGIDRSTIGDMLDRLVKRGLVERRRVDEDGRANALHATAAGRRLAERALAGVARAQARILAPLPPERHGEALDMLRRLAGLA